MNEHRKGALAVDLEEAIPSSRRGKVFLKRIYYSVQRPLASWFLARKMTTLADEPFLGTVDTFLWNEGGTFKDYLYGVSDAKRPIQGSRVLVQGAGYGRFIFQLAKYKPEKIVAFDLYPFPEEWEYVTKETKARFGVEVEFLHGDIDIIPASLKGSFDHIISDAVLEHVRDMRGFAKFSYDFLKPGGVFYASYGPVWFGFGGDHVDWGEGRRYDHVLLDPEAYAAQAKKFLADNEAVADSYDPYFLIKDDIFSKLTCSEYLEELSAAGFHKLAQWAKISPAAISFLASNKSVGKMLDQKKAPRFDRYCLGIYLWMQK